MTDTNEAAQDPESSESSSGTGVSTGPNNPREGKQDATRSPDGGQGPGSAQGGGQSGG